MYQNKRVCVLILAALILFVTMLACVPEVPLPSPGQEVAEPPREDMATATTQPEATEDPVKEPTQAPIEESTHTPTELAEPVTQVLYDLDHTTSGLLLESGDDGDTEVVSVGSPPGRALRTGNGEALPSTDGNTVEDYYMQFQIDDDFILRGAPTSRVEIEIEYLDEGRDRFSIQYDAVSGGPEGDGRFKDTGVVIKTGSGEFKTSVFPLCDAYFANRLNGADFRITDGADGAEVIRRVVVRSITPASGPATIHVDSCGASPFDSLPDSAAVQTCIDAACSGDTVLFTSGENSPDYHGYVIDNTIFLVRISARSDLTFSSTDPDNHALLRASPHLLGFVVRLFARSGIGDAGNIDNITVSHLHLDGNRAERRCYGTDEIGNGIDDNWGSWLPECDEFDDAWCNPGTLGMNGEMDWEDPAQDYILNPSRWSTGLVVDDLHISQTECGTGLGLTGADSIIRDTTIDTAGDHVHVAGCSPTDDDEPLGAWADGITFTGPGHLLTGNTVINPSDIGITTFGGMDTVISHNTIRATSGNYGMFAGINIGPVTYSDVSGFQVVGNRVINEADESCGGIHAGIDIGPHMWMGGCRDDNRDPGLMGNPNVCLADPPQPFGALCLVGPSCQVWAHVAAGTTFTLKDNHVSGAQVNYLIEGLDLVGTLVESGNSSGPPRMTDWESAKFGCTVNGVTDSWGTIDRVAHHPTLDGWVDQRIHCER